jgi:hypothetical protein
VCRESITELVSNTSSITVPNKKITTGHMTNTYIKAAMAGDQQSHSGNTSNGSVRMAQVMP